MPLLLLKAFNSSLLTPHFKSIPFIPSSLRLLAFLPLAPLLPPVNR